MPCKLSLDQLRLNFQICDEVVMSAATEVQSEWQERNTTLTRNGLISTVELTPSFCNNRHRVKQICTYIHKCIHIIYTHVINWAYPLYLTWCWISGISNILGRIDSLGRRQRTWCKRRDRNDLCKAPKDTRCCQPSVLGRRNGPREGFPKINIKS